MKGIVLAGGMGTRLYPSTLSISKHLLPVYDKPMIFYPLSVLMLAGIRDILLISTERDQAAFQRLLGNGEHFGIRLSYAVQSEPRGVAEAFVIARDFIADDAVCLILGDNIFFGQNFSGILKHAVSIVEKKEKEAVIFSYQVKDPEPFGVVELDEDHQPLSLHEKPRRQDLQHASLFHAVTGLYFFSNAVLGFADDLMKEINGEACITDINKRFLERKSLHNYQLGRGFAWLDTGTHDSLLEASQFVQTLEHRQGLKIACLEEIAWRNHWLTSEAVRERAKRYFGNNAYGDYLLSITS